MLKRTVGNGAWETTCDRLGRPYYSSRIDSVRKIRDSKRIKDFGKYSFVNRAIKELEPTTCRKFRGFSF